VSSGSRTVKTPPIRIGCSGWQYRHWRSNFYPADLPQRAWLEYYARQFDTVEVNNSFYKLPAKGLLAGWRTRTPARFLFAVKASRYLTHMKKLKEPRDPLRKLFSRANELRRKRGPVLYQLPRQLQKNIDRLKEFLDALPDPRRVKQTIEFRHPSWYADEVLRLLHEARVALCLHDMTGSAPPRVALGPFIYVRFHGASAKYAGAYSSAQLGEWAQWIVGCRKPAFVYFNNDVGGQAPKDARQLRSAICNLQSEICDSRSMTGQHLDRPRMHGHVPVAVG